MTDDDLTQITDSISSKLGDEQSAIIADDLGVLITKNSEAQTATKQLQDEVNRLKGINEKLVLTNGNLLKQIPTEHTESKESTKEVEPVENINLADAFDKYGNFKR